MDDETVHFVLEAIDMVATHGWKLLPQVSNKNRLEIAFFIRRLLVKADTPIYWLTTEQRFIWTCLEATICEFEDRLIWRISSKSETRGKMRGGVVR